jgi:DeoR/GlpR family transcriptional regulator of sugar metabolism
VNANSDEPGTGKADAAERRQLILDRLQEQESVSVAELAKEFGVTGMSLRRDLQVLAERGLITRVRGGATRTRAVTASRVYLESERRNSQAKAKIARAAAELIREERIAFFYSGSTVAKVAAALDQETRATLTVVTPALPVINEVSSWNEPHLVAVGGTYLPSYMAFVGPQAIASLRALNAEVAIVGCDGLTSAGGLTTPHQLVAELGATIIERSRRTIVVADSSKIGVRGFTPIAPATSISTLVTDAGADQGEVEALRGLGIGVVLV